MCLPLLPLALAAAGSLASYIGQRKADKAQNKAFNTERDRQKDLGDQQTARFQDSLSKTEGMLDPAAVAAAANARETSLANAIVPTAQTAYLPGSSSAPTVVQDASVRAGEGSRATSLNLARTLAALGGTGDQLQALNTGIGRNHEAIAQLGTAKAGSLGVLDSEMKAAAQKGSTLRNLGGLAQTIGSAWLGSSMGGAPKLSGVNYGALTDAANTVKIPGFGGAI